MSLLQTNSEMFENFATGSVCEAVGSDGRWYTVSIVGDNKDGTFDCLVHNFNVQWVSVGQENIRGLQKKQKLFVLKSTGRLSFMTSQEDALDDHSSPRMDMSNIITSPVAAKQSCKMFSMFSWFWPTAQSDTTHQEDKKQPEEANSKSTKAELYKRLTDSQANLGYSKVQRNPFMLLSSPAPHAKHCKHPTHDNNTANLFQLESVWTQHDMQNHANELEKELQRLQMDNAKSQYSSLQTIDETDKLVECQSKINWDTFLRTPPKSIDFCCLQKNMCDTPVPTSCSESSFIEYFEQEFEREYQAQQETKTSHHLNVDDTQRKHTIFTCGSEEIVIREQSRSVVGRDTNMCTTTTTTTMMRKRTAVQHRLSKCPVVMSKRDSERLINGTYHEPETSGTNGNDNDSMKQNNNNPFYCYDSDNLMEEIKEQQENRHLIPTRSAVNDLELWNNDPSKVKTRWVVNNEVEVWIGNMWAPAKIEETFFEQEKEFLQVDVLTYDNLKQKVLRFGSDLRPIGFTVALEESSDDEDS